MKKICGAPALTLTDDDHAWSAQEAEARVRTFAGAETEPNAEYAKAFVAVDGPNDTWASYKLLFADVVDGQLQAVPKALLTAAAVLDGQRGGSGLSGTDLASAKTFVEAYHRAMGKNTPWGSDSEGECRWKGQYLGEYIEYSMCMAAMQQAWYALYYECADALTGYGDYGDMDDAQLGAALSDMFDEHKNLCLSVFQAIRSGGAEETAEQAAKSVRRLSLTHLSSLGDGLTYTKHTRMAVDAARGLVERTKGRLDMRLKEGRALSEANRQTLKDHRDTLEECVKTIDGMLAQTEQKADLEKAHKLKVEYLHLQVPTV